MQLFVQEATGVTLSIIEDDGLVHSARNRYFSVGQTSLVKSAGLTLANDVKEQGYTIKTVDNTIFLLGKTSYGTLYSVYDYLNTSLNYEYYFTDVYSLSKDGVLTFSELNKTDSPDIGVMSSPNAGFVWHNETNRNRFMCVTTTDWAIPANGSTAVHNIFNIIDPSVYGNTHSSWYNADKTQACFSANGNLEEYKLMQAEFLKVIQKGLKESDANIFTISQNDNKASCSCTSCTAIANGANSAVMIKFCNDLVDKVYAWFETDDGVPYARDFYIYMLAYQDALSAPTGVTLNDKVGVWLAIDNFKSVFGVQESTNLDIYNTIQAWDNLTNNFMFWIYDVNFENYFYPYDTTAYKSDFYKLMAELGVNVVNDQSQNLNKVQGTAWNNLKSYVSTKLRWDTTLNETTLIQNFMDNCYLDAADTMLGIYNSYTANWAAAKDKILNNTLNVGTNYGGIHSDMFNSNIFSYNTLLEWYVKFKQALNEIKPIESTDKEAYDKAYSMICAEAASPLYMLLTEYSANLTNGGYNLATLKAEFKTYCTDGKLEYYKGSSSATIESLFVEMGIA